MAEVLHGNAGGNQLNARADKTQVYGLKGNDTLASDGKRDVLLIGGSGDDSLIMSGGNGTLSGGDGSDTFELTYSASKPLSAVIEDLEPALDKIVVNFDGNTAPQLSSSVSGNDVVWSDSTGSLSVTLKGVRENDYFDGTGDAEQDNRFFLILKLTNDERENPTMPKEPTDKSSPEYKKYEEEYDRQQTLVADAKSRNLPWLTLSDGLTKAASIRAQELTTKPDHSRPESVGGGGYSTVFDEVGKHYPNNGENITAGSSTAAEAMTEWIGSLSHHKNILSVNPNDDSRIDYQKLGVGYAFVEEGSLSSEEHYYWEQLFGGSLSETVAVDNLLAAASVISIGTVSAVVTLTEGNDTYSNSVFGATIAALGGNDSICNSGFNVSISGGNDNDTIDNSGSFTTINAGLGNDRINLNAAQEVLIQYAGGNDTISGFNASDTFSLSGGKYTPFTVGNDVVVSLGTDSITFTDAAKFSFEEIAGGTRSKHYIGTLGNDSINVTGVSGAMIQPLGGNDTIDGFDTNDTLQIAGGSYTSRASDSNLILSNGTDTINILGAAGSSSINIVDSVGNPVTVEPAKPVNPLLIVGTEGDDTLNNSLDGATIQPLGGNDYVYNNNSRRAVYVYKSGNDTIEGFNDSDRLNIGGYTYESVKIGNDVIISVGTDSITLKDYAEEDVNISTASNPGDSIYNESGNTLVTGTPNDDTITNDGYNVTIDALAGNDSINNNGDEVTISGGAGSDTITDYGNSTISIDGGAGDDYIRTIYDYGSEDEYYGSGGTISGGAGNDTVFNYSDDFSIIGGIGDDSIFNNGDNVFVDGGAGEDSIWTSQYEWSVVASATMNGGAGNDAIWNYSDSVTVDGGAGNDSVWSTNSFVSISGGAGSDSIYNDGGDNVTINGGDDGDYIKNTLGDSLIIDAGAGNDTILNDDNANVTMLGGAGNDRISLSADSQNNLVRYTLGDGNDTVWGISGNDTLNLPRDAELNPANSRLTSLKNAQGDLIIRVRRNDNNEITGSIILVGAADHPPKITYGESNTSGGGSVGNDSDGGSSQGNGGNSSGGQSGGNTSGGTSASEGRGSAASGGGRSASGSSGRSVSERGGGGHFRYIRNEHSTTANAPTETIATALPESITQSNHQTTATTTQQPAETDTDYIYTGYNQVISDYASDKKIFFCTTYTGAFYDGNGNFFAGSTTGALVVQNAADKVIDLKDVAGNDFVKAYSATTAGVIDGRGLAGFELINGSAGADAIYAGDGGSQLWGGADTVSDAMMGGGGTDIFIGGRTQGADFFLNASSADIVHLNDSTLSDIVATAEENGTIGIAFNTGNVVAVQSSEALSATVMLADGSAYRFNHATRNWQSA